MSIDVAARTSPAANPVTSTTSTGLRRLAATGVEVHLPGSPGYELLHRPWNVAVDQRPAAVVVPADAAQVAAVLRAAAALGLRVAPQTTGHNAGPLGAMGDTVLLRTSRMTEVTVDPAGLRCRVGAGVLWEDVVTAVAPYGLMALHGSSPDVGVAGYSLGGGIGWYARKLGMATNSLTAVELVTPDGTFRRVDAEHEPELFWALRGGGGSFGVVTALEFRLYPITSAYAGALVWDWTHAEEVIQRWATWSAQAPDEVTTSCRILQLPPVDAVPPPLRGRQVVMIDGAVLADDDEAAGLLAGLRELQPEMDLFTRTPAPALARLHGDPEGPTPGVSDHTLLRELPPEAVSAFVAASGPGSGSTLTSAELRQLGGALGRPHPGGGVMSRIDGAYALFAVAIAPDEVTAKRARADAARLRAACAPWDAGRSYLNFTEEPVDAARAYRPADLARLRRLQAQLDPQGLCRSNHPVTEPVGQC